MKKILTLGFLASLTVSASAAVILNNIDVTGYNANIGGFGPGAVGTFDVDSGAEGFVEFDGGDLTPENFGGISITVAEIDPSNDETITFINDLRIADEVGGTTDTLGAQMIGASIGDGFNFSFSPNAAGTGTLTLHVGTFQSSWFYSFNGGASTNTGAADFNYNEGTIVFNFTTTDASDNVNIDLTSGNAGNLFIGSARLDFTAVPEPSSTALFGLGSLGLLLRRRK